MSDPAARAPEAREALLKLRDELNRLCAASHRAAIGYSARSKHRSIRHAQGDAYDYAATKLADILAALTPPSSPETAGWGWTASASGSNNSPAFEDAVQFVTRLIRNDAATLIAGRAHDTARLIVAQLAHVKGFAPSPAGTAKDGETR